MIRIRRATNDDRLMLAALQAASWRNAYRDALPADYLTDDLDADLERHWRATDIAEEDVVLVAEDDEDRSIVGFIAVWVRPDPYIDNLHVRPGQRSRGIGRRLMAAAAERLMAAGQMGAYLWVLASNQRAIAFYESLGGVTVEEALQPLFAYQVPNYRIEWKDLSEIVRRAEHKKARP
jgi:ribosomal protein S18 acetylase RimI-like enzyme